MIIPSAEKNHGIDRLMFYTELARECSRSRRTRFEFYKTLRNYYLFGTADASGAAYNKIASTIETRWSFMYAPAATRFSLHLGSSAPKEEIFKVRPLIHELNDQWRTGKSHMVFDVGGKWSHVFGSMVFKNIWRKGASRTYLVEPHMFGVLREDKSDLSDQEAFVHHYTITRTELEMRLEGNPKKDQILARIPASGGGEEGNMELDTGLARLILASTVATNATTGVGGSVEGGIPNSLTSYDYSPQVEVPLVDMMELYVWNDEIHDYQMVTMAGPMNVVFDRKHVGVAGIPPFVVLRPEANLYDYFWGESDVAKLSKLQDWRNERVEEIRRILNKQANPPMVFTGFGGIPDERWAAFMTKGGYVADPTMTGKATEFPVTMPPNTFAELDQIDRMFDDAAGIGHILQGKGEPGVRSKGQADLMARLGSARPKSAAVVVEEAAEELATLIMRTIQENSKQRFQAIIPKTSGVLSRFLQQIKGNDDGNGNDGNTLTFTADQFTNDFEVRVDAHSSSPIFFEDRKIDANELFDRHAITRERLIEAYDPADKQQLLVELEGIEKKEEAEKQQQMQAQQPPKKQE